MSDNTSTPVRVMHLVSSEGATGATQQALFMPMLTRMPKQRVKMLVVSLSPNAIPGAVLRQNGVPVYDVALSKHRFSLAAFSQLIKTMRAFRPDVIQAWGHTAQIVSHWLRGRCEWDAKLVWTVANTAALPHKAGFVDTQKLKYAAKYSRHVDNIVYTSEAAASAHRRVGFPEDGHTVIPLGVDPTRFKPDFAARRKVREKLGLAADAFVIGMVAPFQPEYDHTTLFKAVGELIKTEPKVHVLLAGHGVQKGNAPLMALVGGGALGTRTQLLGEWSDAASFFNACDLACSSALTDNGRMSLVIAMLCGIPCVATGMGAQGEVIGQHGVAVEPSSPVALIRGITRVLQLPPDKRVFMAQGARKHALNNFVVIRSLQKYLQIYYDLAGRQLAAATAVPVPEIDATIPQPKPAEKETASEKPKPKTNAVDMSDPDSLESRDSPTTKAPTVEANAGDVLQLFESSLAKQASTSTSPMSERARGVADDLEDLLAPELLQKDSAAGKSAAASIAETAKPTPANAVAPTAIAPAEPLTIPAQSAQAVPAAIELSLVDTIALSMKINVDATGTLEIPPELIFSKSASVAPQPAAAVGKPATTATPVAQPESKQLPSTQLEATQPIALVAADSISITADSSTVPALAVDAILSNSADSADPTVPVEALSPQLDLLDDMPPDQKRVAGDGG